MLASLLVSRILAFLLLLFFSTMIPLDLWMLSDKRPTRDYGIKSSNKINVLLSIPSIGLWIMWFAFAFNANQWILSAFPYLIWQNGYAQMIGLLFCTLGVFIAISARIARGKYAPSWGLHDQVRLVTRGPYRIIRHPNYLFYCLMFFGFPLLSGFWPSILMTIGIYGYVQLIEDEEKLLLRHFGQEYEEYQTRTWRLIPLVW